MSGGIIRLLMADDHPVLREGIAAIIRTQPDIHVVAEAEDGEQAVAAFRAHRPDVTLMDLQMPCMGGLDAILTIRREFSSARIIVLTTHAGDFQATRALRAGVTGYLLKSSLRRDLLDAIRQVHEGGRHIPDEIAQRVAIHAFDDQLTAREMSVLKLVANGNGNKQIAFHLSVSEDTVKAHLKSIFSKLDVADRTHAVTLALRRGIIEL